MKENQTIEWKECWRDEYLKWNPGELPETWTIKKLFSQHSSRPFNPLVANAFFRAGEIEAWGRGIQRIVEACRNAGAPVPKIKYDPGDLWFEFAYSPVYLKILSGKTIGRRLDEKLDEKIGTARATILRLMRDDPVITVSRISSRLKMSRTAVDKNIQILKSRGYIKRIGPAKGGRWEVTGG